MTMVKSKIVPPKKDEVARIKAIMAVPINPKKQQLHYMQGVIRDRV